MNPSNNAMRPFLIFCGLIVVTACLYWAQEVLIPVALAALLTFIMGPAVTALQHRGLPRVLSVLLVVTLVFALVGGFGWVIAHQVGALAQNLRNDNTKINAKLNSLFGPGTGGGLWGNVQGLIDEISGQIEESNETSKSDKKALPGETAKKPLFVQMAPSGWSRFSDAIGPAARGLATTFLVVVLVLFMLMQRENLRNRVVQLIGGGRVIVTTRAIDEGARRISRYLIMQVCINTAFGLALAAGLFLLGLFGQQRHRRAARAVAEYQRLHGVGRQQLQAPEEDHAGHRQAPAVEDGDVEEQQQGGRQPGAQVGDEAQAAGHEPPE